IRRIGHLAGEKKDGLGAGDLDGLAVARRVVYTGGAIFLDGGHGVSSRWVVACDQARPRERLWHAPIDFSTRPGHEEFEPLNAAEVHTVASGLKAAFRAIREGSAYGERRPLRQEWGRSYRLPRLW